MEWRQEKKICDCSKFDHGAYLFVEEGDPSANFNTFNWKQEISQEQNTLTFNLNDPEIDPEGLSFSCKVSMLRTDTVQDFKAKVGTRFKLQPESLYLVRNGNGKELKEMSKSLAVLGLTNGTMIQI